MVYDGKSDPCGHMTAFSIAIGQAWFSEEEKDAGLCQLFVEKLSRAALQWFTKLKPESIDTFVDLSQSFMKQYSMFIPRGESSADLWNMTQGRDESLRSFIERFKAIASRVTIDDGGAIEALWRELWYQSKLCQVLGIHEPAKIKDAFHRATRYIKMEEECVILHKHHTPPKTTSTKEKTKKKQYDEPQQHYDGYKDEKGKKATTYFVSDPRPLSVPWNKYVRLEEPSYKSYCDFHSQPGHSTAECSFKTLDKAKW